MKNSIQLLGETFNIVSYNAGKCDTMLNGWHYKHIVRVNNKIQFTYHTSINDYQKGIKDIDKEGLLFAFRCFIQDAQTGLEFSFSDFCYEFGYEEYSYEHVSGFNMEAKKIFNACVRASKSYKRLTNLDAYDLLDEMSEKGIK